MFALFKVHCQDVQLDNDITAKFFIVAPGTRPQELIITLVSANLISHLASRFLRILGTGFNSAIDIDRLEISIGLRWSWDFTYVCSKDK